MAPTKQGPKEKFLKKVQSFSGTLYNYDVDLLKMSRVMLETCRGF
jgi:hypothetical protein